MNNYANSSLEERIERRRKQRRAARRKKLIIFAIALLLIVGIGFGAHSIFSGDETEEKAPIEVTDKESTPETEQESTPEETPEAEPETEPEVEPEVVPEEEPEGETETAPEDAPAETAKGGNNPLSLAAVKGSDLLAEYSIKVLGPIVTAGFNKIELRFTGPNVDPEKPMVALTFDDGPSGKYGGIILDALEKHGARASYFVLGELVDGNSANLKRAVELGCEIGNHSYDHPTLTKLSAEDIKSQISRTSELVQKATGNPTALVRTPGGAVNATVKASVGAPIISWSLDTVDWKSRNTDAIVKIVLDNVQDGDIILMHEIYKTSAEAAEIIIPELIKRGYQLVTVSEMMEAREVELTPGKVYFSAYPKKKAE